MRIKKYSECVVDYEKEDPGRFFDEEQQLDVVIINFITDYSWGRWI